MAFITVFGFGEIFEDGEGLGCDAACSACSTAFDDLPQIGNEAVDEVPIAVVLFAGADVVVCVGCCGWRVRVPEEVDGEEHCGGEDLEVDDVADGDERPVGMTNAVVVIDHFS